MKTCSVLLNILCPRIDIEWVCYLLICLLLCLSKDNTSRTLLNAELHFIKQYHKDIFFYNNDEALDFLNNVNWLLLYMVCI